MEDPSQAPLPVHAGLTELLGLKRHMFQTVCRYGLITLSAALLVTVVVLLSGSSAMSDLWDWVKSGRR